MTKPSSHEQFSWTLRRRFMFAVSAFCMLVVGYILVMRLDTGPADTAMTMAFFTLIGIVGSYVFGATWEDVATKRILGPKGVKPVPGSPAAVKAASATSAPVEDAP